MADDYNQSLNELARQVLVGDRAIATTGGSGGGGGGDASAANQVIANTSLDSIDTKLDSIATESTLSAVQTLMNTLLSTVYNHNVAFVDGSPGQLVLGKRRDSDSTLVADGDLNTFNMDEEGRLKVASKSASFAVVTGNMTTVAQTVFCDVSRASNVSFHVKNTGSVTLAAGTFIFEGSVDSTNGTNGTWFGVQVARSNANTTELQIALSGMAAGAGFTTAWECSVNAYTWFRIRCSVAVTASAIATWTIQRGTYATEPVPIIQVTGTQPISGAVTLTSTTVNPVVPATPYFLNSAATTNGALILTGTSNVSSFYATNEGATTAYVKLYNKAIAPTVGTDIPEMIIPVPAAVSGVPGVANPRIGFHGFRFALGLGIAITRNAIHTDTTAIGAGEVKVKLSRTV